VSANAVSTSVASTSAGPTGILFFALTAAAVAVPAVNALPATVAMPAAAVLN